MGGGKGGDGGAGQARKDEQERQAKIRAGTSRINDIFNGSTIGDGLLASGAVYDPTKTYYTREGKAWSPTAASGGAGGGGVTQPRRAQTVRDLFEPMSQVEEDRRARGETAPRASAPSLTPEQQFAQAVASGSLYGGTKNTGGFNDEFFAKRRQDYIDYATPQLEDQYTDANKQLTFALARSGQLNSSVRGEKASEIQKLYDTQRQKVADDALSYETQSRTAIEDARANLITTLNATGDAEGAANAALARSQALSQPTAYSPLSQLFADFTAGLGVQAAQERSHAAGGPKPRYDTGLFAINKGAVQNRA